VITLGEYLENRWREMPEHSKKLLGLPEDLHVMAWTNVFWTKEYYDVRLKEELEKHFPES